MIPTVQWLQQKFSVFNQKYFNGELPTPRFALKKLNGMWGGYDLAIDYDYKTRKIKRRKDNGTIVINSSYERTPKSWANTLLHEMAHEYVYIVMGVYPADKHGKEFMSVASKINADGWNIAAATAERSVGGTEQAVEPRQAIICIIQSPTSNVAKWWICKAEKDNMQQFEDTAKKIQGATSVKFYYIKGCLLSNINSDPATLLGYGGNSYAEAAKKMADFCRVSPYLFGGKNLTLIK